LLHEDCGVVSHPSPSNNVAEYTAAIEALTWLVENEKIYSIILFSDSQLLIYQLTGYYSVKSSRIIPLYNKVFTLLEKFPRKDFQWIPREKNVKADALSRKAYIQFITENPHVLMKYKTYLATEKQKRFMDDLKINYPFWITKREASRLISERLRRKSY